MNPLSGWPITIQIAIVIAPIVFGVPPLLVRATTPATAAEAVACGVRCAALCATALLLIPIYERAFSDFGADLPAISSFVLRAFDGATYWLPGLLILVGAETVFFYRLYRDPERRPAARRLSGLATAAVVAIVLFIGVAMWLPLLRLLNELS